MLGRSDGGERSYFLTSLNLMSVSDEKTESICDASPLDSAIAAQPLFPQPSSVSNAL